jgi:hypothetical protein
MPEILFSIPEEALDFLGIKNAPPEKQNAILRETIGLPPSLSEPFRHQDGALLLPMPMPVLARLAELATDAEISLADYAMGILACYHTALAMYGFWPGIWSMRLGRKK